MKFRELAIPHSWEITPALHPDSRGVFLEWFRLDLLEQHTGRTFPVRQANQSVSGKGVFRGIHYADVPPGQAKLVTVTMGAALDFVVDLRRGSPTYGRWDTVLLDDLDHRTVYLAEGLGHAFVTLTEQTVVNYLVTTTYNREAEHAVSPLDPRINLDVPDGVGTLHLSDRDRAAPTLAEAERLGILPSWDECLAHYATAVNGL